MHFFFFRYSSIGQILCLSMPFGAVLPVTERCVPGQHKPIHCHPFWATKLKFKLTKCHQEKYKTRTVGTPKGRPTWWLLPPSRWWFRRVGENYGPILAVSGPKFMKFWDNVGEPSQFPTPFPVVYIMFLAGDTGAQVCHWVVKSYCLISHTDTHEFLNSVLPWMV